MNKPDLDLYTDYLLSTFGAATATGLSAMVEGKVSHDQVTRFLSAQQYTCKDLWHQVKRTVRSVERDDGVLIFDDTIQEKACTDEGELMCWHFDHCSARTVRGVNLRTLRSQSNHVFMAIYATFKLECLSITNKLNPFALCRKLLINASRSACAQLQVLRAAALKPAALISSDVCSALRQ